MKKHIFRTITAILIAASLLTQGAFAVPSVTLDDAQLQMQAAPIVRDGRTYVPFRAIFEAMGARVAWDNATGTVSATRGEIAVSFGIGKNKVQITQGDETRVVTTDAAAFLEKGNTYVPVRFAAQAFGANVGWDAKTETVLLVDSERLAQSYTEAYTLMNRYLELAYPKEPRALSGRLDLTYTAHSADGDASVPIIAAFTATADSVSVSGLISFSTDISQMTALLGRNPDAIDEGVSNLLTLLRESTLAFVLSRTDGALYLKGAALDPLGVPGGAWVRLPLDEALSTLTLGAVSETTYAGMRQQDYQKIIMGAGTSVKLQSAAADNVALVRAAMEARALPYADARFVQTGEQFHVTDKKTLAGGAIQSEALTLTVTGDHVTLAERTRTVTSGEQIVRSDSLRQEEGDVTAQLLIRGAAYDADATLRLRVLSAEAAPERRPSGKIVP